MRTQSYRTPSLGVPQPIAKEGQLVMANPAESPRAHRHWGERLFVVAMIAVALAELYFFELIPSSVNTDHFLLASLLLCFVLAVITPGSWLMRAGLTIAGLCLGFVVTDLVLRPFLVTKIYGPRKLFMYKWVPMPSVWRFTPNVKFDEEIVGDLGRNAG